MQLRRGERKSLQIFIFELTFLNFHLSTSPLKANQGFDCNPSQALTDRGEIS